MRKCVGKKGQNFPVKNVSFPGKVEFENLTVLEFEYKREKCGMKFFRPRASFSREE